MTLEDRLREAQTRSTQLYLERQSVERSRQQIVMRGQQIDVELLELDGVILTLQSLIAEQPKATT